MKLHALWISLSLLVFSNCKNGVPENMVVLNGATILERVKPPKGYQWVEEESGSFAEYLQYLSLEPAGTKILDYEGNPIRNQFEHIAVLQKDIGAKNLQQCADAVIRLRADYLWDSNRQNDIEFHFTNGDLYKWKDYKKGIRPVLINSNTIEFKKKAPADDSYAGFRKYLDIIFMYSGTISLNKETEQVRSNSAIKAGDILITSCSPGHAVIIVGRAVNANGTSVYLLAQGYTPAQSIHIIANPFNGSINPWYQLDINKKPMVTARYSFRKSNIRSFRE